MVFCVRGKMSTSEFMAIDCDFNGAIILKRLSPGEGGVAFSSCPAYFHKTIKQLFSISASARLWRKGERRVGGCREGVREKGRIYCQECLSVWGLDKHTCRHWYQGARKQHLLQCRKSCCMSVVRREKSLLNPSNPFSVGLAQLCLQISLFLFCPSFQG